MQEVVDTFTTAMTWLTLLMSGVVVVVLGLDAWQLSAHRRRALFCVLVMLLVLGATGVSLVLLAAHRSQEGPLLSQLLLPLVAALLLVSIYRLSFPSPGPAPAPRLSRVRLLLLLFLTGGTVLATICLVLLDLLFS